MIPKKDNPSTFADFRPISLCHFCYKILSKQLVTRLSIMLPKILSKEQSAFVKGRKTTDNISIAQERTCDLDKKVRGGNFILKLDMMKAYDRLE